MILAIGLEAAELTLIKKYIEQGHLPLFAKWVAENSTVKMLSPASISSGATWPSVNTGTNPAKHGIGFYHRQLKNGTYKIIKKYADSTRVNPFWEALSAKGKKMAILDAPDIYCIPNFNGKMLIGWGGEALNHPRSSWPPSLLNEMINKYGDHPLAQWYQKIPLNEKEWIELQDKIVTGLEARTKIYKDILLSDDWDLFFGVIAETHWVGHFFWHMIESSHPDFDADLAEKFESTMLLVYQQAEKLVASLQELRPEANLIVFSNTGMGPNFSGRQFVTPLLRAMGLAPNADKAILPQSKYGVHSIKKIEDFVGAKNLERLKKLFPEKLWDSTTRNILNIGNNWAKSQAFELPADYTGCIRINLEGREPHGKVTLADYDEVCSRIRKAFLGLTDQDGNGVVSEVIKIREVYKGPYQDDLPDLAVIWKGDVNLTQVYSEDYGSFNGILDDKRTGAHLPYGFLVVNGHQFNEGDSRIYCVEDIAPTILGLLGEDTPTYMDGKSVLS